MINALFSTTFLAVAFAAILLASLGLALAKPPADLDLLQGKKGSREEFPGRRQGGGGGDNGGSTPARFTDDPLDEDTPA